MAFESALFRTGLPIPPVFVITATKSHEFFNLGRLNPILWDRCKKAVCELEAQADQKFAITLHDCTYGYDPRKPPLFLNVEADCIVPLRGHQARVVNIGLNDHIVEYCASTFGSPGAIYRSYAQFLQSYGTNVLSVPDHSYRNVIKDIGNRRGISAVRKFSTEDWKEVVRRFKRITAAPQDPYQQLACALEAVYSPWCSAEGMVEGEHCGAERRAAVEAGIAVRVQAAVSGGGEQSGAGIAHVHNRELRTVSFAPGAEVRTTLLLLENS
jgi:pyruvate,orthophosphate dikinase